MMVLQMTSRSDVFIVSVNSIQVAVKKGPPTSFSPVTSANVASSPQNFLTFIVHPFATLVYNFKAIPSASPKLLNLNQDHPPQKK